MAEQASTQTESGPRRPQPPRQAGREGGRGQVDRWKWARELGEQVKDIETVKATELVEVARKAGKQLKLAGLNMNQIRRFLTELREIESALKHRMGDIDLQDRVVLLRPKLAYAAGRQREQVRPLMEILDPAIRNATSEQGFTNLLRLVESIVAYHRFYGGE
ncbi:MAG: type III-A CRISPR-associated protein Csm2 [Nitrospirae bacterium]|nr:MAG: type III-A CRISPR-associated protein Csm2 [Nitrospirota bacterium]